MFEYSKVNVKLSDTQLKNLKTATKNKTETTLRMSLKIFDGDNLLHELCLTTSQRTRLRNAYNNNMPTDLKLSKAQISKIIQSGGFLGSLLSELVGPLMKVAMKENIWFRDNNFNNFKRKNKRHNENCSSS